MNTLITRVQIKIQYKAYLTSFLTHTYIFACLNFLIFTLWFLEIHTFDIHKLTLSYFQDWHTDWNLAIIDNYQQSIHRHVGAIRKKTKNLQISMKNIINIFKQLFIVTTRIKNRVTALKSNPFQNLFLQQISIIFSHKC